MISSGFGFDAKDQMERYCRWWHEGYMSSNGSCFDIGNTVVAALRRFEKDGNPIAGSTDPYSAGNGSIMRLAPVPLVYFNDPANAVVKAAESSLTTHGATVSVDACRYMAAIIVGALNGESKETLLGANYGPEPGYWDKFPLCPEIASIAAGSFKTSEPPVIKGTGYAAKSLEAALWAFYKSDDFKSGCLLAANLGDDADTTAAIYGQIAGAHLGVDAIPAEWLAKVADRAKIEKLSDDLFEMSNAL